MLNNISQKPFKRTTHRATLSIIIPSQNPDINFFINIRSLVKIHPDWQVIVVDDCSTRKIADVFDAAPNLLILRNDAAQGAGASRNKGIDHASGKYIVFMDDDDFMDWDVVSEIIGVLDAMPNVDMSVSYYNILLNGKLSPAHLVDRQILEEVLSANRQRSAVLDGNEKLLRLTNFPWNKVYRGDFVRKIKLRFSDTAVQNDIHAHWQSMLKASRILVTSRVQCTKIQNDGASRISNTADHRRLQAFAALRETYTLVSQCNLPQVELNFWVFYIDLVRWMIRSSTPATGRLILREHTKFVSIIPPEVLRSIEDAEGIKPWEFWSISLPEGSIEESLEESECKECDQDLILASEVSRLKHLATSLIADNEQVRERLRSVNQGSQKLVEDLSGTLAERLYNENKIRSAEIKLQQAESKVRRLQVELDEAKWKQHSSGAGWSDKVRTAFRFFIR